MAPGADEEFNVQLRLARQTREEIADFKRRGAMVDEYAQVVSRAEAALA